MTRRKSGRTREIRWTRIATGPGWAVEMECGASAKHLMTVASLVLVAGSDLERGTDRYHKQGLVVNSTGPCCVFGVVFLGVVFWRAVIARPTI